MATWAAITAGLFDSEFTLATTGSDYPMLGGNVVSLCSPIIIIAICQLIWGHAHYDFELLAEFKTLREILPDIEEEEEGSVSTDNDDATKGINQAKLEVAKSRATIREHEEQAAQKHQEEYDEGERLLKRSAKYARIACVVVTLILLIIWPMPMYGSGYIFSKQFFTGWIVVAIIWLFFSLFVVELLPLWQGRFAIAHVMRGMCWDLTGKSHKLKEWQEDHPEDLHYAFSPVPSPIQGMAPPETALDTVLTKQE